MLDPSIGSFITNVGLPTAALLGVAWVLYRFVRDALADQRRERAERVAETVARIVDLEKQRDEAIAGWKAQTDATKEVAATVARYLETTRARAR